jgi:hypothetical protein
MNESTPEIIVRPADWLGVVVCLLRIAARLLFAALVLCGTAYLVFWRSESGWLFAFAVFLLRFLRRF